MPLAPVLLESHKRFIVTMLAQFMDSPTEIAKRLNDQSYADKHGFELIDVKRKCVSQHVVRMRGSEAVVEAQVKYLADFTDTPLAYKKQRVLELVGMYEDIKKMMTEAGQPLSDIRQFHLRRAVLSQIKDEIGEDLNKLADAIRDGKPAEINLVVSKTFVQELAFVLINEGDVQPVTLTKGGNGDGRTDIAS